MSHTIVIFGASGDLTSRKLIPALYRLHLKKRLPADTRVVGYSRTQFSDAQWRDDLAATTKEFTGKDFDPAVWKDFAQNIFYQPGDISQTEEFESLDARLLQLENGGESTRVYYLSVAPRFYEQAILGLGTAGMAAEDRGPRRIVVEKPFGTNLQSAKHLNGVLHQVFAEHQVYRIDHYLGKETVQNILVLRFANTIFEPIWNRNYIDHVQITAAEAVPVGKRAGYYDTAGVVRDMFQNHLLQLLTFTAMEAPSRFEADLVRNEKVKVLEAIRPLDANEVADCTFRARYQGYLNEDGVAPGSQTATFAAVKLAVDNWRWQGVPFYLRSGKAMDCRTTQIVIQFRQPPHSLFGPAGHRCEANRLVMHIQPAEGLQLDIQTKVPDAGMVMRMTDLDFRFDRSFRGVMPEAYERLLLDTLAGDASLFARSDEVELAWRIVDPILESWQQTDKPELLTYETGQWGPPELAQWMARDGRQWLDVCPVLS